MRSETAPSGRAWHRAARLDMGLCLALTLTVSGPADRAGRVEGLIGAGFANPQHGWPWIYLAGSTDHFPGYSSENVPPWLIAGGWNWSVKEDLRSETNPAFSWTLLLADLAVAAAILLLSAAAFELWRRRRTWLLQFHMSDLVAFTLLIGLLLGWWHQYYRRHARMEQALHALSQEDPSKISKVLWRYAGPDWLREARGPRALPRQFESIVMLDWRIDPGDIAGKLSALETLTNLRQLHLDGVVDADLPLLVRLPHVEFLILESPEDAPLTDAALSVAGANDQPARLLLRSLTRLQRLSFHENPRLTRSAIDPLQRCLPACWIENLIGGEDDSEVETAAP